MRFGQVPPLPTGISAGQIDHAKSIIRLAKLYLKERGNGAARKAIATALRTLADELEGMKDLDGRWPPSPRGYRPGTNPDPVSPKPEPPPNPPPALP